MKMTTITSVKFMRLKRKLGLTHWQAVGLLESLWVFVAANAMAGDVGRHTNEDIAAAIEWSGDCDQMINVLVETGWLDNHPECRLVVHDWDEHCPTYIKGIMSKKGKTFFTRGDLSSPGEASPSGLSSPEAPPATDLSSPVGGSPSGLSSPETPPATLLSSLETPPATLLSSPGNPSPELLPRQGYPRQFNSSLAKGGQAATPEPAHHLTTNWNFYARGSRPGNETFPKVIEVFAEALRRGIKPATIQAAIEDPKRDRTEPLFLFSDRELRPQQRKGPATPKSTEELLDAMTADSRQRDVLEVAYHGRN